MNRSALGAATLCLSFLGLSFLAHATEPPRLDPIIVTATRLTDDVRRLPAQVTIIDREAIARSPAKTLPDLLALEAGVHARSLYGNQAAHATVDLRGFGATATQNTLILVDGRRLNDVDLAAVDYAAIPTENIERIEIIRGGGAVLYGDGAVGGAINIVTRTPAPGVSGQLDASAGSYDTYGATTSVSMGGNLGFHIHAGYLTSDGYRRNNDLDQHNVQASLRQTQGRGAWHLQFGMDDQSLRLPGPRRVDATSNQLETDRRGTAEPNNYGDQRGYAATAGYTRWLGNGTEVVLDGGYRRKHQQAFYDDYDFGGLYARYLDTTLATWSATPRLRFPHRLFGRPGSALIGLDYYHSQYDSDRAQTPTAPAAHRLDIGQTSLALYGQNTADVGESTLLTMGARLQHVKQTARDRLDPSAPGGAFDTQAGDFARSDTEPMADIGLRQALSSRWSLFAKTGRSVRFATVDELYEYDPSFVRVFSPLEPQRADTYDLGAEFVAGETRMSVGVYRMDLKNEIHFNPLTFTNDNLDPTRRHGLAVSAATRVVPAVRITGNYGFTRATFREGAWAGNDVPLVPAHTASASVIWEWTTNLTLSTSVRYVGAKRFDNDQDNTFEKIPAYETVDVKLANRRGPWRMEAAVYNLLDELAFDYGVRSISTTAYNAYPLPGRRYSLSAGRSF